MTEQELVNFVVDDITVSGSLKLSVNEDEVKRIIKFEKNWWHRYCRDAVELQWAVMNPQVFRTPEFRKSRTIQLPDCVYGIEEFREIKDGSRLFGISDPDLSLNRVMMSDLFLSPFMGDAITSRTITYSWYDLTRSFILYDIQFDFNWNSHRLKVIGHDPISPVLIRGLISIDDAYLFEDYNFQRWIVAKCKTQLHRVLKTFESNTLGNVSITSLYKEEGEAEIKDIKEQLKGEDQPDWFLMVN